MRSSIKTVILSVLLLILLGRQSQLSGQNELFFEGKTVQQCVEAFQDKDQNWSYRQMAIEALGEMGPKAKIAIPELLVAMNDDLAPIFMSGCHALEQMGPDVIPILIETLKDKQANTKARMSAARALGTESLFGKSKKHSEKIISVLEEVLKDKCDDGMVRFSSAYALGDIGPDAKQTLPTLIKIYTQKTENAKARSGAGFALGFIVCEAEQSFRVLAPTFENKDEKIEVRFSTCIALEQLYSKSKQIVPMLIGVFQDKDEATELRYQSARSFAEMIQVYSLVEEKKQAMPVLLKALQDKNENKKIRGIAARSLGQIDPKGERTCVILVDILLNKDEHVQVRVGAILGLGRMDTVSKEAINALNMIKQEKNFELRKSASQALGWLSFRAAWNKKAQNKKNDE